MELIKDIKTNINQNYTKHICYKLRKKCSWYIINYLTCEIKFLSLRIKKVLFNINHKNLLQI